MITLIILLCSKCFRFHGLKLVRNCFGSNIYILYVLEWKFNFKYSSSQGWNFFFYFSRTNYLCWILIQFIGVGRVLSLNLTWRNPLKYVRWASADTSHVCLNEVSCSVFLVMYSSKLLITAKRIAQVKFFLKWFKNPYLRIKLCSVAWISTRAHVDDILRQHCSKQ